MDQIKLESLLEKITKDYFENELIEFKESNKDIDVLGVRISAIANSANLLNKKQGFIIYGVRDSDKEIVGTSFIPSNEKIQGNPYIFKLEQKLSPSIDLVVHEFKYKNKYPITIFQIPPAKSEPVKYKDIAYIRINEATPKLSEFPEKERKIWHNVNKKSFEKNISLDDLTVDKVLELLEYNSFFKLTETPIPSNTEQFVNLMSEYKLVNKVLYSSYDITNLGAILFATDLSKFDILKRKAIRVINYKGINKVERIKDLTRNLGYAADFESLIEYIMDKLPHSEEISKAIRKEVKTYPEVAIREFVANALIHQDFSIGGTGPTIEIFSDRIEITNPGNPLIETNRFIDHPPISRNEDLASFMRQVNICEEGGTGIDRALTAIAIFQLPAPKFETYENFTKITIFGPKSLKNMTLDDRVRACFQHCVLKHVENKRMTNATLRERLSINDSNYPAASQIIRSTIDKGLIKESEKPKEYVPIWA